MRHLATLLFAMLLLTLAACSKESADEAKQKVLDKKDTAEEVKNRPVALTALDLSKVPGDAKEVEKLFLMTAEETAQRLKSYKAEEKLSYLTQRKEKEVKLSETHTLEQAENGDFYMKSGNEKASGFELYWVGQKIYDRMGTGPFRPSISTGKHLYWREKSYGALNRFYKYFRGHIKFTGPESTTYEGRDAMKISIVFDPNGKTPEDDLPDVYNFGDQYAVSVISINKLINRNRKSISHFDEASGYLVIDKKTATVVAYKVRGKYAMPIHSSNQEKYREMGLGELGQEVIFVMEAEFAVNEIGMPRVIAVPSQLEDQVKRDLPPEDLTPMLPEGAEQGVERKAKMKPRKKGNEWMEGE